MTTLALPSWFIAAECEMQLVPEVRGFSGPYGGPSEVYDLLGDRWRMRITMPEGDFAAGAQAEAFFNRLRGGADWLALHHLARPVPRGTARGSMVLTAGVSQGGNSMALSGLLATPNLLNNSSFEIDTNADGVCDGWAAYSTGTTGTLTYGQTAGVLGGGHGTYYQYCSAAALNGRVGVQRAVAIAVTAGTAYAFSVEQTGTGGTTRHVSINWLNSGSSFISETTASTSSNGRLSCAGTAPVGAAFALLYTWGESSAGTGVLYNVDQAQFEQAAASTAYAGFPTLLAGDMLGHGSEQLFQVYSDFTASDAGAGTVTLVNRARKAIASGQSIVWSAPTVPFMLLDAGGVPTSYRAGRSPGQTVTLEEAWA